MFIRLSAVAFLGISLAGAILAAPPRPYQSTAAPRNPIEGKQIYRQYCASCHGVDGKGHGPASVALKHGAPDLTLLAKKNGGKFPFERVKDIIEGKENGPSAHGDREMPVWGPVFHEVESDMDFGELRVDAVAKTLEAMQEK